MAGRRVERGIYVADRPRGYYLVVTAPAPVYGTRITALAVAMSPLADHAVPLLVRLEALHPIGADLDDELRAHIYAIAETPT